MQTTSAIWDELWQSETATLEAKAIIDGVEHTDISPPVITRALMQGGLSIGNVVSAVCTFSVDTSVVIPKSAEVQIKMRLTNGDEDDPVVSEWLPAGTFYVSRRTRDPIMGVLTLECYDALLKSESVLSDLPWTTDEGKIVTTESGERIYFTASYPYPMVDMVNDLSAILGVEIDSRTQIETDEIYVVNGTSASTTIRDVLGQIAAAHGGNWIITSENKLYLVPVASAPTSDDDLVEIEAVINGVYTGEEFSVSGVRCTDLDNNSVLYGNDSGIIVDVSLSQGMAAELYNKLVGLKYRPYTFGNAIYNPAIELGDYIRYNEIISSVLFSQEITIGPSTLSNISAPDPAEVADEFPYISSSTKNLAEARAYAVEVVDEKINEYDDSLDQESVFNKLTDNGATQGIYLQDSKLYINGTYMQIGTIRGANGKNYWILDGDGAEFVVQKGVIGAFTLDDYALSYSSAAGDYSIQLSGAGISTQRIFNDGDVGRINLHGGRAEFYWNDINTFDLSVGDEFFYIVSREYGTVYPMQIYDSSGAIGRVIWFGFDVRCLEDLTVDGNFTVTGTKSRVVNAEQYGDRLMYCYETPSPMFGDVGEGVIGEDGKCYVSFDPIFAQTVATAQYQVFLQKYGGGECWVNERRGGCFIVHGTPGLSFGWEVKAKQKDFDQRRLDRNDKQFTLPAQTYGADAARHIDDIRKERISA